MYNSLNYIRGLAALFVVIYHYFIFFFIYQWFSAMLSLFEPLAFDNPLIETVKHFPFDLGQFSVGLFFLLSGFLAPSLVNRYQTRGAFLKNRFFRLWPIYTIGLLINILFIYGGTLYTDAIFPYSSEHIMASFLSLRDVFGYSFITGIVWTFEIEVKFVLFCLCVYPFIKNNKITTVLALQTALYIVLESAYFYCLQSPDFDAVDLSSLKAMTYSVKHFSIILIGMYIYMYMSKTISLSKTLALTLVSLVLFNIKDMVTEFSNHDVQQFISYVGSFLLFSFMCYMENKKGFSFPFQKNITNGLNYISKISYPLYLIHALPGYVVMYICYYQGYSLLLGMAIGLISSFVGAHYLTKFIETPIRLFGNSMSKRENNLQFVNP